MIADSLRTWIIPSNSTPENRLILEAQNILMLLTLLTIYWKINNTKSVLDKNSETSPPEILSIV